MQKAILQNLLSGALRLRFSADQPFLETLVLTFKTALYVIRSMLINAIDESNNRAQAFRGLDINMIREAASFPHA